MIKRKPSEWVELTGIEVIDADGWALGTWETPITFNEFIDKTNSSTIRHFSVQPMTRIQMYGDDILRRDWEEMVSPNSMSQ